MRDPGADELFECIVDRDTIEREPGASRELSQVGHRRGVAHAGAERNAVPIKPGVADVEPRRRFHPSVAENGLVEVSLDGQLAGNADVQWACRCSAGHAERGAERRLQRRFISRARANSMFRLYGLSRGSSRVVSM